MKQAVGLTKGVGRADVGNFSILRQPEQLWISPTLALYIQVEGEESVSPEMPGVTLFTQLVGFKVLFLLSVIFGTVMGTRVCLAFSPHMLQC